MKTIFSAVFLLLFLQNAVSQETRTKHFPKETQNIKNLPNKQNLWIFVLAGQSNMAGRGLVEPQDTLPNPRILTLNKANEVVIAKEPLHYYEPVRTGLDCGLSFAKAILRFLPDSVSLLLVPTAVGGSSIQQWLGDSTHNSVKLLTNATNKIEIAKKIGLFKGILWHQGEANANSRDIDLHSARLTELFTKFRSIIGLQNLPILMGELGNFPKYKQYFPKINEQLSAYLKTDKFSALIKTDDLPHKGDSLHFNAQSQRLMGQRFAISYITQFLQKPKPSFLKKDSIYSKLDQNLQRFFYRKSTKTKAQPLIVELHSWSFPADSLRNGTAYEAQKRDWNYIFPNFRGVNNHVKACCSEFAINDIDEAIDWALKNMNVDKKQIYVVGVSGGGYATMAMYMKSRHKIAAFSGWVGISDLEAWFVESSERKNKYADEILACTGSGTTLNVTLAHERSPLFWETPSKRLKESRLRIYTGIHDGHTGSVPITQSINFYNKLVKENAATKDDFMVSQADIQSLLKRERLKNFGTLGKIDERDIHLSKHYKNIWLTVFEGGHEILPLAAVEELLEK